MSVSSHLTPEPERRLWLILDSMRHAMEVVDAKIAALTAFAAAELAFGKIIAPVGLPGVLSLTALSAALPLGILAFSSLRRLPKWLLLLELGKNRPAIGDNLVAVGDVAKYSHGELISKLDRYLGGGITAMPYYEDIIGEIVMSSRIAARKQRLFRVLCVLVGIGQLCLVGR